MNVLKCTVRGNGIAVVGGEMPVVGSCNYDKIRFQFDGDWNAYYKVAYFWQEENEKIGVALDANYEAEIPYADLDPALTLKLAVKGYTSERDLTVMRSTHTIGLKPYEGADGNVGNIGGAPDLYEQVLADVGKFQGELNTLTDGGEIDGLRLSANDYTDADKAKVDSSAYSGALSDCHAFTGAGIYAVPYSAVNFPSALYRDSSGLCTLIVSDNPQESISPYTLTLITPYGEVATKTFGAYNPGNWVKHNESLDVLLAEKSINGLRLSHNDYTDADKAKVETLSEGSQGNYTLEYAPAGSGVVVNLQKDGSTQSYFNLRGKDGITITAPDESGNPINVSAAGKLTRFDYDANRYNADTMLEPGVYPGTYAGPSGYPISSGDAMPILIVMETGRVPLASENYDFPNAKTIMQICIGRQGEVYSRYKIAQDAGTVVDWPWSEWATKDISVYNSLASTSTTSALSAAQGKVLGDRVTALEAGDKYELIETINVTEDGLQEIARTVPGLKEMRFKATIPTATANSIFICYTWNEKRHDNYILNSTSVGSGLSNAGQRYLQGRVFDDKGYWGGEGTSAMGDTASSSAKTMTSFQYAFKKAVETYPCIDVVVFRSNSTGVYFPVGTTIEVWGVRA